MKNKREIFGQLQNETRDFAVQVVKFYGRLPQTEEAAVIGRDLLRSGTSVGAKCAAAMAALSRARFNENIFLVVEELGETVFRLELLVDTGMVEKAAADDLLHAAQRLYRVFMRGQLENWRVP